MRNLEALQASAFQSLVSCMPNSQLGEAASPNAEKLCQNSTSALYMRMRRRRRARKALTIFQTTSRTRKQVTRQSASEPLSHLLMSLVRSPSQKRLSTRSIIMKTWLQILKVSRPWSLSTVLIKMVASGSCQLRIALIEALRCFAFYGRTLTMLSALILRQLC